MKKLYFALTLLFVTHLTLSQDRLNYEDLHKAYKETITVKDSTIHFVIRAIESGETDKVLAYTVKSVDANQALPIKPEKAPKEEGSDLDGVSFVYREKKGGVAIGKTLEVSSGTDLLATLTVNPAQPGNPDPPKQKETKPAAFPQRKDYIDVIQLTLQQAKITQPFIPGEVFTVKGSADTVYIFLDSALNIAPGTQIPDCNKSRRFYRFFYIKKQGSTRVAAYDVNATSGGGDLVINAGQSQSKGKKDILLVEGSKYYGPFEGGLEFTASVTNSKNASDSFSKKYVIPFCEEYHVSIVGGFYMSTLNNPTAVTAGVNSNGDSTLFADHATTQRALTIMAIFYPMPRKFDYRYKDLSFWEKWSICFGTKLSEDLFNDLLLGLNYEFSKGGSFAAGIHYGEHKVLSGYKKFEYGKDVYTGKFDNAKMKDQWDTGFFIGVNIDLRVITSLRRNGREQREQNESSR